MTKTFSQMTTTSQNNLMLFDAINIGFRYLQSGRTDFAEDYVDVLRSLARSYKCKKLVLCCDWGKSTYRTALSPAYKANRTEKREQQTEAEKQAFEAFFAELTRAFDLAISQGIPLIKFKGVEADDIIAFICKNRQQLKLDNIWIISSDKDLNQLVDLNVAQFSTVTRKEYTIDSWSDHYEYFPEHFMLVKTLTGDAGDNVKGAALGLGPKKAILLAEQYDTLDNLLNALPIASKYKYIQALNDAADVIILNDKLMNLSYCEEAIGEENIGAINEMMKAYL